MRHHRHGHRCGGGPAFAALPLALAMTGHRGGSDWGWGGFGPGAGRGWGGPRGGGRRARGDVRAAILLLLEEEPRNGYGLMQEVEQRTEGAWRPSPGSVYPALSQLEDEGLVEPAGAAPGKAYALTEAGRAYVEEHRERLGTPWQAATHGMPEGLPGLRQAGGQLAMATTQVVQTGDAELIEAARRILDEARKSLYRLLAGDDEPK